MTTIVSSKRPHADRLPGGDPLTKLRAGLDDAQRALIIGGYGCGNLGDEAILTVMFADFRAIGMSASVVTADPAATRRLHHVPSVAARPREIIAALREHDAVIIGGGGIFSAYMGPSSKLIPALALAAKAMHKKVAFRALGVYASTPPIVGRALALAMQRADFVSVRDDASIRALRGFGVTRAIEREDDPALRLEPSSAPIALPAGCVGIAARRLRDPRRQDAMRDTIVATIDGLVERGRTPVLLPFCAHPSVSLEQDDRYAAEILASVARPGACRSLTVSLTPRELLGVVGGIDAMIAMRFHALVFAHVARIPIFAIPYDDKCAEFVAEHAILAPPPDADAILAALDAQAGARAAA